MRFLVKQNIWYMTSHTDRPVNNPSQAEVIEHDWMDTLKKFKWRYDYDNACWMTELDQKQLTTKQLMTMIRKI